jgi:hypothetical protein
MMETVGLDGAQDGLWGGHIWLRSEWWPRNLQLSRGEDYSGPHIFWLFSPIIRSCVEPSSPGRSKLQNHCFLWRPGRSSWWPLSFQSWETQAQRGCGLDDLPRLIQPVGVEPPTMLPTVLLLHGPAALEFQNPSRWPLTNQYRKASQLGRKWTRRRMEDQTETGGRSPSPSADQDFWREFPNSYLN